MITADEIGTWARRFGVPESQVVRDHLVSHLLLGLRRVLEDDVVFFGGTALCRSHLPDARLSEDIDLLAEDPRALAQRTAEALPQQVRREFPRLTLSPAVRVARSLTLQAASPDVEAVQLQFVAIEMDERRLRFREVPVVLRYSDVPPSVPWRVPDPSSFVAMKMRAWRDRFAPRDLFDLHRLAEAGHITDDAHELLRTATGVGLVAADFRAPRAVTRPMWETELARQVADLPELDQALAVVRRAVERVLGAA